MSRSARRCDSNRLIILCQHGLSAAKLSHSSTLILHFLRFCLIIMMCNNMLTYWLLVGVDIYIWWVRCEWSRQSQLGLPWSQVCYLCYNAISLHCRFRRQEQIVFCRILESYIIRTDWRFWTYRVLSTEGFEATWSKSTNFFTIYTLLTAVFWKWQIPLSQEFTIWNY